MTIRRLAATLALGALCAGCEPLYDKELFDREEVPLFRRSTLVPAPPVGDVPRLRVMAWNIKYGAGRLPFWFDCYGDRVQMTGGEVAANMQRLYDHINEVQPDVLMTEEIELNSRRSDYYDMVRGILEHTNLNYAAWFETWDSRYIASEGLGRMTLGNAIFSRHPIRFAERIKQVDRTDQSALTSAFYIHRAVGRAELELSPGRRVTAMVVHTEAYDNDGTKQKQIEQIYDLMKAERQPFVLGGDFNELPPTAKRLEGFADERTRPVCDDAYKQPPYTPQVMQRFYDDFTPAIGLDRYGTTEAEQQRYYSHTVLGPDDVNDAGVRGEWNRTLDYLWVRKADALLDGDVLQRSGQLLRAPSGEMAPIAADVLRLSDHAPVFGIWEVR
jgi:endonuclease/exonuclease/phosphatase family metal-dependent hydrolase